MGALSGLNPRRSMNSCPSGKSSSRCRTHRNASQFLPIPPAPATAETTTADRGPFTYANVNSQLCVDVPNSNTINGTVLQQWHCNGCTDQQFR